ncbi:MAG: Flp pilus assembly protein CpaB [Alphaproteobacteria bacterium]|jgi:pilus assembly protein CpaB|nr:Flp pilus assembly protein CpaB [Alphaproteobacteria bacterium]
MQRLEPIIAVIAFVVAILVAFGVYHLVYTAPKQTTNMEHCPPLPEMKEIMIAKSIINTGDPINGSIVYEKWPTSSIRAGFYAKDQITPEQLKSLIARRIINQGEPIAKNSVVDRKDHGVLSALLNEGMRAVSIGLDQNSGMSGLLNPGDIVDVIVALNNTGKEEKDHEDLNRTILCGVRVLAIDQHLSSSVEVLSKKVSEAIQAPKSVTLEVTPRQASALASAVKMGTISLSLHSSNDDKTTCVESSLKPVDQIKIIRGDGTQAPTQQK